MPIEAAWNAVTTTVAKGDTSLIGASRERDWIGEVDDLDRYDGA